MPNFAPLDSDSERQVRLLAVFRRKGREYAIRKDMAEAAISLCDAVSPLLRESDPSDVRVKARLLKRASGAYERLANHPGAMRYCAYRVDMATRWLRTRGLL